MPHPIIVVRDLNKSYGNTYAVQGVSFEISRGEIFGLLGPNGAGKTTTISMLTGLIEPTSGTVQVDGDNVDQHARAMKAKLGLVPQELALYPTLTAFDNLVFFGRIYGLKGNQLKTCVAAVLEMVGLADRAKDTIETFSGGMKRRINIAAGLVHEPDILFLDEPTVGVDPHSRNAIFESIETLNQAGLSILYTTHYMEEAERLCDRIAIVDHGKIIAMDSPKEMIRSLGGGIIRMGLQSHLGAVLKRGAEHPAVKAISPTNKDQANNDPVDNNPVDNNPVNNNRMGGELIIEPHHTQDALMALLEITNQLDTRITSLEVLEPNLETVFLRLTGKSLRD